VGFARCSGGDTKKRGREGTDLEHIAARRENKFVGHVCGVPRLHLRAGARWIEYYAVRRLGRDCWRSRAVCLVVMRRT
jgi:hypothetical protein